MSEKTEALRVRPLDFAEAMKTAMRAGYEAAVNGETFTDAWVNFTGDESPAIERITAALDALQSKAPETQTL